MKAVEFIQKHKIEKAVEILNSAPKGASYWDDGIFTTFEDPMFGTKGCHIWVASIKEWKESFYGDNKELFLSDYPDVIDLDELKQVVDSLLRIEKVDGIKRAKSLLASFEDYKGRSNNYLPLLRAVEVYEAVYGDTL